MNLLTITFKNYEQQVKISYLELDCEFFTPNLVSPVNDWVGFPYPEGLESLQVQNAPECSAKDANNVFSKNNPKRPH